MKTNTKRLVPSVLEYAVIALLTIGGVVLANSRQLLGYYGLSSSDQVVKSSTSGVVEGALKNIDSLSATSGVVTFAIWAVVGIVCFGIVEALAAGVNELRLEGELTTGRYVHPATFTKAKFWRGVLTNAVTLVIGLGLLAVTVIGFMLFVFPLGLAYSRPFLYNFTLIGLLDLVLGLVLIFVSLMIIDIAIRLLVWRRQVFSL